MLKPDPPASVLLNAVTNAPEASFQTNKAFNDEPRRPIYPMSTEGVPEVCPSANVSNGS